MGCGGEFYASLARLGANVTGIDENEKAISIARTCKK